MCHILCVFLFRPAHANSPMRPQPRRAHIIMPHRCIADGCSNTRKDGVSLYKWPEDAHFAKLWTNAVKNTHSDVFNPLTSQLYSAHFIEESFEEQSVIAKSLG